MGHMPRYGTPLTPFEVDVLRGLAAGQRHVDTGKRTFKSASTVKSALRRVYARLGAASGAHAVSIGYRQGILTDTMMPLIDAVLHYEPDAVERLHAYLHALSPEERELARSRALTLVCAIDECTRSVLRQRE